MTTRIVETEYDRHMLLAFLENKDLPMTVEVTSGKHRTSRQNKLQMLWMNEIAQQKGEESAEWWRGYCKLHHGIPILRAESELFREEYDRVIRPMPYETKIKLMMVPFDFAVTRKMKTSQKTKYLESIYRFFTEQGVQLTSPDMQGLY